MRYLPHTEVDRASMLRAIGVADMDALFSGVPSEGRHEAGMDLPPHAGELAVEREISDLAAKNLPAGTVPSFLGAGAYRHHVPAAVDHLIQRGEFLTAYTPYQPEIAQGTLQALFEFQTQVAMISGLEVANASMYDGATACAEAVMMARRVTRKQKALLSGGLHPHYRAVTATHAAYVDYHVEAKPPDALSSEDLAPLVDDEMACVVVQNPGFFGHLSNYAPLAAACHDHGALLIVVVNEVVSLGAVAAPGSMGADIFVGEGQSIGNALNFGGPYLGLFATRERFVRQMPGRLCGETEDDDGRRGWVLTLPTREQHIRREKATSNICTNSGLCALAFAIHMALLGEAGFTRLARLNHANAVRLADRLGQMNHVTLLNRSFFNEFTLRLPCPADEVVAALAERRILAGVPVSRLYPDQPELADLLLVAATETNSESDMDALHDSLGKVLR